MRRTIGFALVTAIIGLIVAFGFVVTGQAQQAGAEKAKPAKTLESLLKEAGFDYTKTKEGTCKIFVTAGEQSAMVYADEVALGEKKDTKLIYLYCLAVEVPSGFKHPIGMLKKIAEINDGLMVGKLGISPDTGGVWYSSSLWLRTADADTLTSELALALFSVPEYRKELKPFVKEE